MNIGERVGDYEIVEVLGNGGMGEVYKVRNLLSERVEAMKVLLPNLTGDPELAERFLREIKLQASLDHPNIAKLNTAFRNSNQLLMVMEFVDGVSVEKLLANGPLLTNDAISYASQVLDALAYAHGRGVVHRDIKPANVMRTPSGVIKLLDFGIAHMKKADFKLTKTGTTLGSLYYIAPELINGSEPNPRCDIYSLGVVLYEMVTGRKPFQGDSQYSIMAAHMQGTPIAPTDAVPWVPGPLNDLILKAMAKDPASRFQSAEEFKAALQNFASLGTDQATTQVMATPPPPLATQVVPASTLPMQTAPPPAQSAVAAPPPQATAPPPPAQPAMAAPLPPMPPPQASSGRGGLYVILGCILTLGVLVAAAIAGPRFFKTLASGSHKTSAPPAQTSPAQATSTQDQAPGSAAASSDNPSSSQPSSGQTSSNQTSQAAQEATTQPTTTQTTQSDSTQQAQGKHTAQGQSGSRTEPSAEAQRAYRAQMKELREEEEQMNIRASTANSGLSSIKRQMSSQGLGLRADVLEAETRMNYLLEKAQREISSGDAVGAERDLKMAGYAIASIEKFLGH